VKNALKMFSVLVLLPGIMAFNSCKTADDHDMSSQAFVTQAASGNLFEIAAGNLALNSGDTTIRAFGSRIVADYGKAESELAALASKKGWSIPTAMGLLDQANLDTLTSKSGSAFTQKFASIMVMSQGHSILLFQTASGNNGVPDAELSAFAAGQLPMIKADLQLAEQLPQTVVPK
jgi:putative membrane protein